MDAVFYPGAAKRRDPAFVRIKGLFAPGFGGKKVGNNNGENCKKDGNENEKGNRCKLFQISHDKLNSYQDALEPIKGSLNSCGPLTIKPLVVKIFFG